MKKSVAILLIVIAVSSCTAHYRFRHISEFNLQPNALKDGEPLKLLYTSQGPNENAATLDYYIQVIAVSQITGDTVNILTPFNNGFVQEDGDKIYNYLSPESATYGLVQMDPGELAKLTTIDSLPASKPDNINRVARDPDHDDIAHNNFPTVIGAIGTLGNTNK